MYMVKKGEWCEIIVPAHWSCTIEQLLKERWQVPKKLLHQYRMEKSVIVNGEAKRWSEELQAGDVLRVRMFLEEDLGVVPEYMDVDILYEDDHVLIVNKPIGMDTHPADKGGKHTLANGIAYYLQAAGIATKVRHIHRLDKDTSGAVVFAKHALAGVIMDRLLHERRIKRTYMALVEGKLKEKKGVIDAPIGRDRHHAVRRRVSPKGDHAVTHYELISYMPKQHLSLVELQLETGRTHQIRVHMSYIGHPLAGDHLYGSRTSFITRQALHAMRIRLLHPITEEMVEVSAPIPADITNLL